MLVEVDAQLRHLLLFVGHDDGFQGRVVTGISDTAEFIRHVVLLFMRGVVCVTAAPLTAGHTGQAADHAWFHGKPFPLRRVGIACARSYRHGIRCVKVRSRDLHGHQAFQQGAGRP